MSEHEMVEKASKNWNWRQADDAVRKLDIT